MKFPIAGIAASAGGLDAFSEFLSALAPESGIAYVFIQHLDPDRPSLLPTILGQRTPMPVISARDGDELLPNCVYVIPPNATLRLVADKFQVTARPAGAAHHPGDIFLRSLAETRGEAAIGIVLSGGDGDGALGIRAIKDGGGTTFAQAPDTARFPSMPQYAIATGCVDFVLAPRGIAEELARIGGHPYLREAPVPAEADSSPPSPQQTSFDEGLSRLFQLLRSKHGLDFNQYKRSTLQRRLARRMMLRRIDSLDEYIEVVEADADEAAALYKDFLIRVTEFFRETESFEVLRTQVFPKICENRSRKDPIRVWVPGCSSGEEVYSLAISLVEFLGDRLKPGDLQFFGTDVSEAAIDQARSGRYLIAIEENVSPERLARFFSKDDAHYRIAKSIRDLCVFARQDLTRDPPFSRIDLISCRNVLIYFDPAAQRQVMQVFHYALRPDGFLMLGHAESVGQASDLFDVALKPHRLYRRKALAHYALNLGAQTAAPSTARTPGARSQALRDTDSTPREADRLLLGRYAPPSLLVDDALNIVQFRGETAPYVEHATGAPSLNLQRVVRAELLADVAAAIQEARATKTEVRRIGLAVDDRRDVTVTVLPLHGSEPSFLVMFEDGSRPIATKRSHSGTTMALTDSEKDRRLAQAEREVVAIREFLQDAVERHDAIKEELKSAHEEALSANEEYQSTNEELETSKEELQSANEELATTNEELNIRNTALDRLNDELRKAQASSEAAREHADAIIETVREPLLVLQADLTIIRANQSFYEEFQAKPEHTIGRHLEEIAEGAWTDPAFVKKLSEVLSTDSPLNDFEIDREFPRIGRRVVNLSARRMTAHDQSGSLILLAIENVTDRRAATDLMKQQNNRKDEFLAVLAHELRNPLAPIRHAVYLLQSNGAGAESASLYNMIERQTNQLVRLVDELLDVARIGRGQVNLQKELVDFAALVREVCEANHSRTDPRQQRLIAPSLGQPVYVYGDPARLQQVVANLLSNASKYSNRYGNIVVTLTADDTHTILTVKDDGIGIAHGMLEAIFELFAQVDRSLARSGGGLGLGLSVVRRVLELHGGTINARSAGLGTGSEFIVRLPLAGAHDVSVVQQAESIAAPDRNRRVLIVDDNADGAESLAMLARGWGHDVAVAHDAASAFALVSTFHPDTALVDIGLPGMNGYDIARRLRQDPWHKNLFLIAVTGYGAAEDREAASVAGFDVHMTKPVAIQELRSLLAADTLVTTH